MRALSHRASIEEAFAWIDAHAKPLGAERVAPRDAVDRILAEDLRAPADEPPCDRAAIDGIALRAEDAQGAGAYNPVPLRLVAGGTTLPARAALRVDAGDRLIGGIDTVVPLDHAEIFPPDGCEVIEAGTPGAGIERAGSHQRQGAPWLAAGRRLRPADLALLAAAGSASVPVLRRPRIAIVVALPGSARSDEAPTALGGRDADGPLLEALAARDGGAVTGSYHASRGRAELCAALSRTDADVILLAGGTGPGSDDAAAEALAAAGTLAIHGCALQPGETAGLGRTAAGVPVFLLPGTPVACLWAYEMLAGRAVRRRGGRDPALPFPTLSMTLARKLVSTIGTTEIHPVRRCGRDAVEQAETFSETGLAAASRADGFVIVPAESEGVAEGAAVTVHLYEPRAPDAAGPVGAAG